MSEQSKLINTSTSSYLPVKRRRGRPRKDENLVKKVNSHTSVTLPCNSMMKDQRSEAEKSDGINNDMVGQVVSGVIEGSFDAGYFLSVKVGNTDTLLRGVVFQPGLFTPITAANDIAPTAMRYKRREFPAPVFNLQNQDNGVSPKSVQAIKQPVQLQNQAPNLPNQVFPFSHQSSASYELNSQSGSIMAPLTNMAKNDSSFSVGGKLIMLQQNPEVRFENKSIPSLENLSKVEQDETMQAFEGPKNVLEVAKDLISVSEPPIDYIMSGNVITDYVQNQAMESGLDPSDLIQNGPKSSNLDLVQTSDVAKPQSVPPGFGSVESDLNPKELVHSDLKSPNLELNQTPAAAKLQSVESGFEQTQFVHNELDSLELELHQAPAVANSQFVPQKSISEPMEITMETEKSPMCDIQQDTQLEPAAKVLKNDETYDGKPLRYVADNIEAGSLPAPMIKEATPFEPNFEESDFMGRNLDAQISCSADQTTDFNLVFQDAILPTEFHNLPSNNSEKESGQ